MHELSIALSIVEVAAEAAERQGGVRVEVIHLRLGPLSGVIREALLSAFGLAAEGSPLEGARLEIEEVEVEIDCPTCRTARPVESVQEMRCRVCGTPSAQVIRGRELEIVSMEVCDEQPAPLG